MTELPITVAISMFNRAHYLKLCLEVSLPPGNCRRKCWS